MSTDIIDGRQRGWPTVRSVERVLRRHNRMHRVSVRGHSLRLGRILAIVLVALLFGVTAVSGGGLSENRSAAVASSQVQSSTSASTPPPLGYWNVCAEVANETVQWYWVPELIVNSPFGAGSSAQGTYGSYISSTFSATVASGVQWTFSDQTGSGSAYTISATGGASEGNFQLVGFTVFKVQNKTEYTYEKYSGHCFTPYVAVPDWFTSWTQNWQIAGDQSVNILPNHSQAVVGDPNVPVYGESVPTVSGLSSMGYNSNNDGGHGTCGGSAYTVQAWTSTYASVGWSINLGTAYYGVQIGGSISYDVVQGSDTSYTYTQEANSNLLYDSLTGSAGGGLGFSYSPCGGGGGGCVASGTPVLTYAAGDWRYVPVQRLRPGDLVGEYNFSQGRLVPGALLSANSTKVTEMVDINNGLLRLTPADQPIFISNATFVGWLHDPQNLTTADSLFDPVTSSWIPVTSVSLVNGTTRVYDVVTSEPNNFIGNGVLLDRKA